MGGTLGVGAVEEDLPAALDARNTIGDRLLPRGIVVLRRSSPFVKVLHWDVGKLVKNGRF